jgi:hypothetical protein
MITNWSLFPNNFMMISTTQLMREMDLKSLTKTGSTLIGLPSLAALRELSLHQP